MTDPELLGKTGVFPFPAIQYTIRQPIVPPKASNSEHFRGHFQPKSGKRTAIIAYSKIHVPEFAVFCNQSGKNDDTSGTPSIGLPSERPDIEEDVIS